MVAILKSAATGALRAKTDARIRRPGGPLEPRMSDSCGLEITAKPATASRRTNVTTTWVVCSGSARAGAPYQAASDFRLSLRRALYPPYATAGVGMSGNSESWWIALRAHCSSTAV